jgi:hypothetical protein
LNEGAVPVSFCVCAFVQACAGEAELRGAGTAVAKSEPLSSVSAQPSSLRATAVVLPGAGVECAPSKQSAPP